MITFNKLIFIAIAFIFVPLALAMDLNDRLELALGDGLTHEVARLLDAGAQFDGGWKYDGLSMGSILVKAAKYGHEGICKLMLERGADVNSKMQFRGTALLSAAKAGHESMCRLLIASGATINAKFGANTPLRIAVEMGHESVCKLLLENSADVNQKFDDDWTVLMDAVVGGQVEMCKLLLSHGADLHVRVDIPDEEYYGVVVQTNRKWSGQTALILAAQKSKRAICELLVRHQAQMLRNEKEITKFLNTQDNSGKKAYDYLEIDCLNPELCGALFATPAPLAKVSQFDLTRRLLWAIIDRGSKDDLKELLVAGADANRRASNKPFLIAAIERGNELGCKLLIEYGAEMNAKDGDGNTALMKALLDSRKSICRLLLSCGANIYADDANDIYALWRAVLAKRNCQGGHLCKLLAAHQRRVNNAIIAGRMCLNRIKKDMSGTIAMRLGAGELYHQFRILILPYLGNYVPLTKLLNMTDESGKRACDQLAGDRYCRLPARLKPVCIYPGQQARQTPPGALDLLLNEVEK